MTINKATTKTESSLTKTILLNGKNLRISDLEKITKDSTVKIKVDPNVLPRIKKTREFIDAQIGKKVVYGVNTGFGPMCSYVIGKEDLKALQRNLVRSHAVGMGQYIKPEYSLATMVIRLNTLLKGYSGASEELLKILTDFINNRIIPVIPEHGAVGTSGDLIQLAHIALAITGEGKVWHDGKLQDTVGVLAKLNLKPYELKAKEGLAIINGTSVMTAISAILAIEARKAIEMEIKASALAIEVISGFSDSINETLHDLRPHPGQKEVARQMREITKSSKLLKDRKEFQNRIEVNGKLHKIDEEVQDVYSFRCAAQVIGPVLETLERTEKTLEIEMNSVTDNPLVDIDKENFIHGGNFHGDYIANVIDFLKIALVKMSLLSERRTNFLLHSKINGFLPPFINLAHPGLTLGLQAVQFVATSTAADNQTLAFPHYIHNIPTNADNFDVVSMGTDAALFAEKVLDNVYIILAIELITLAQAVDYLKNKNKLSLNSRDIYNRVRKVFPAIIEDRIIIDDLPKVVELIHQSKEGIITK